MLITLLLLIVAYLLGSIPSGLWIGHFFYKKDLHTLGSGNTGTTNTFRVLGFAPGLVTFVLDVLKGVLAVLLPAFIAGSLLPSLVFGLIAVIGHTFSIFDHFRGGRGVATSGGILLAYSPFFILYIMIVFLIVLCLFSMVSLASLAAAVAGLLGMLAFPSVHFILPHYDWLFSLIIILLFTIILLSHRSNFKRIRERKESTVPFGMNLSHQIGGNKKEA